MSGRERGYYIVVRHSVSAEKTWETMAGPFLSADEAMDATQDERTYSSDYDGCALTFIDGQGYESQLAHPRLDFGQHQAEAGQWHFGEKEEPKSDEPS